MKNILIILSLFYLLNGIFMLVLPEIWFQITPGAAHSGAMNVHFIRDVGLGFCAASGWVLLPKIRFLVPIIFIAGHGILHTVEILDGHFNFTEIIRDGFLTILPAVIFSYLIINQEKEKT